MISEYPNTQISSGVYEINEFDGVSMFLIEGSERALLIDTGVGIGDLKSFLKSLTDKPVDVFITHNHRDHAGNAPLFEKVYISSIDKNIGPMVRPWTSAESRLRFAHRTLEIYKYGNYPWVDSDIREFNLNEEPEVIGVEAGYVFDLGDRTATCLLCPGHTPGSMMILDSKTGYLFCGDCCNYQLGLGVRPLENPDMKHASVEEALQSLKKIWAMDFDHNMVFCAHTDSRSIGRPLEPLVFSKIIDGLEKIIAGDYVVHKEWIQVIDTVVDTALFDDVAIQFHSDNILKKNN